jgi:hypothetical protein
VCCILYVSRPRRPNLPLWLGNVLAFSEFEYFPFQFKDFLQLYNVMSESCFLRCVTAFNSRALTDEEVKISVFSFVIQHNVEVEVSGNKEQNYFNIL